MGKGHLQVIAKIEHEPSVDQLEVLEILHGCIDDKIAFVQLGTPDHREMYLTRAELEKFSADLAAWLKANQ